LPGVTIVGGNDNKSSMVSLFRLREDGQSKSTAITTLRDWPEPGLEPLVLAFDPHGPDACVRLGITPMCSALGSTRQQHHRARTCTALAMLFQNIDYVRRKYSSLVIDCASTMVMSTTTTRRTRRRTRTTNDRGPRSSIRALHQGDDAEDC
jgi:hypothetical protein